MLDYDGLKKIEIKKNLEIVKNNYLDNDFQFKIKNHCEKFNISIKEVNRRIADGDLLTMSFFCKDPLKQNFYEKTAAKYISEISGVSEFNNLPGTGKNTIFLCKDNIIKKDDLDIERKIKSIDFKWKFNKQEYYAYHKFINENGGHQDNQFMEVLNSIIEGRIEEKFKTSYKNHNVFFICDGDYFTESKINKLNKSIENNNHKVIQINELENILKLK